MPLRDQLEQVYKTTGVLPEQLLQHKEMPEELAYVWEWFLELKRSAKITWMELAAWSNLKKLSITPFEADLIMNLDSAHIEVLRRD